MGAEANNGDEATCGKGIAAGADLPEKLSALLLGTANVLDSHVRSLDPGEANGKLEIDAYRRVIAGHRDICVRLDELADLMRGYRDIPMASHDMTVIMDDTSLAVFSTLVDREKELLAMLQDRVREYDEMLAAMRQG